MTNIELILDFSVQLGGHMISSGASLERVNDTIKRICISYQLHSISIFSLNSTLIVSAKDQNRDNPSTRQISISGTGIHLEKLAKLNALARKVCSETPSPKSLQDMLTEAVNAESYSVGMSIAGTVLAMISLGFIFMGNCLDALLIAVISCAAFVINQHMTKINLNRILANIVVMFIAGFLSVLGAAVFQQANFFVILIVLSFMVIPGIPMVNAFQNILCGNEMNGVLSFFRVLLETVAICVGLVLSIRLGNATGIYQSRFLGYGGIDSIWKYILAVIASFTASFGFGIVFQIRREKLLWAGVGGALTRALLVPLTLLIPSRVLAYLLSAMFAAAFAEILARKQRVPSTFYLYPAIIPLIPGDKLYDTFVYLLFKDAGGFVESGEIFLMTLIGISLGFALINTITYYKSSYTIRRDYASHLLHITRK